LLVVQQAGRMRKHGEPTSVADQRRLLLAGCIRDRQALRVDEPVGVGKRVGELE